MMHTDGMKPPVHNQDKQMSIRLVQPDQHEATPENNPLRKNNGKPSLKTGLRPVYQDVAYQDVALSVGMCRMATTDEGLCFLQFHPDEVERATALQKAFPRATLIATDTAPDPVASARLLAWHDRLEAYLHGENHTFSMPLDMQGTPFQLEVWAYLRTIPYGETRTYAEVARGIGRPDSVRAVASACAANRTAIVIPCHRVLRSGGALGGYRWGLEMKRQLLALEKAHY